MPEVNMNSREWDNIQSKIIDVILCGKDINFKEIHNLQCDFFIELLKRNHILSDDDWHMIEHRVKFLELQHRVFQYSSHNKKNIKKEKTYAIQNYKESR